MSRESSTIPAIVHGAGAWQAEHTVLCTNPTVSGVAMAEALACAVIAAFLIVALLIRHANRTSH